MPDAGMVLPVVLSILTTLTLGIEVGVVDQMAMGFAVLADEHSETSEALCLPSP